MGKVFDETGDRLTPSHANKKSKRYRYYISNRLISRSGERGVTNSVGKGHANVQNTGDFENGNVERGKPIGGWRLPADTLERAVVDAFTNWVNDPALVSNLLQEATADEQQHIQQRAGLLLKKTTSTEKSAALVATLIQRMDLQAGELTIRLDAKKLADALAMDIVRINPDAIILKTLFQHRKPGVETKLLLGHSTPQVDAMLIRNVAQARSWYGELKAGASLASIAQLSGTTVHMINRILPLAFLSPSIVEAICTGRQPPELTSRKLRNIDIPMDWTEQEKLFELS